MRRSPSTPSGSVAITSGGAPCHQVTTGTSGASSGITTDSAWRASRPCMRSTTASPGPSRPPTTISASSRDSVLCALEAGELLRTTMISRHGCAAAAVAAALSASRTRRSSTEATRVRAWPLATPPALRRSAPSALMTSLPVVSHSAITSAPRRLAARASWPAPRAALAGQHLVGRPRAPLAGPVRERGGAGPRPLQRVDHAPAGLDLVGVREQRAVADEHVQHQPLVRLRARLGERLAVLEVHRDVADLHRGARHLRAELERDALVRLD